MIKKISWLCIFFYSLVSCNNQAIDEKLIIGGWRPTGSLPKSGFKVEFFQNHLAVTTENGVADPEDSVQFNISKDGKILKTTEKSGKTDEFKILKLSKTELILIRTLPKEDTIRFKKE